MKKFKKGICALVGIAVLVTAAAGLLTRKSFSANSATAELSFHFDGISDGEAPDGTALSAAEVRSTMVKLLEKEGNEAEVVVTAAGSGGREVPNTSYQITLQIPDADEETCADTLEEMLNRYREWFHDTYYQNSRMYETDPYIEDLLDHAEYRDVENIVKTETGKWKRYLSGKENGLSGDLPMKVQALIDEINTFETVTLPVYSSHIEQSGVSRDPNESVLTLSWKLFESGRDYELNRISYEIALSGITLYDAAMSNSVLVPTLDQSSAFYMSRTKIGVDYLAETAEDYLDWSEGARNTALSLENTIGKLQEDGSTYAEIQFTEIKDTMKAFQEKILALDEEIWLELEPVRVEVAE